MDDIEKTVRINELLHIYESQISSTQKEILENYFVFDLSMSEIAEDRAISKAAVEDAVKKGIKKLEALENDLHLLEKKKEILEKTKELKSKSDDKQIASIIKEIERIID